MDDLLTGSLTRVSTPNRKQLVDGVAIGNAKFLAHIGTDSRRFQICRIKGTARAKNRNGRIAGTPTVGQRQLLDLWREQKFLELVGSLALALCDCGMIDHTQWMVSVHVERRI